MAEDDLEDDLDEDDDEEDGEGSSAKGGKKKLLIIVGIALLLVVGGFAAAYFTGLMDTLIGMIGGPTEEVSGEEEGEEGIISDNTVFLDLEDMLVNLNTGGRKATYLKIRISLEIENAEDIPKVEKRMPRIIDNFQVYLRELRVEDLKGSAGMYRLREELLTRVNTATFPAKVNDVLFREMLVQ